MNQQDIADALNGQLQTFTGVAQSDIAWEGVTYRPTLPTPYLSVRISSYTRTVVGTGPDAVTQHDGTYTIIAYCSADDGRAPAGAIAGQLRELFKRSTALSAAGVPLILVNAGEQPGSAFGDWYGIPLVVTFTALETA